MMAADRIAAELTFIRVVLARPQDSKNIGAVCRAMKTMGLTRLYITGGNPLDREKADVLAIHASDVLEKAVFTETLEQALAGCDFVAGSSRRWGKQRKYLFLEPVELSERIADYQDREVALVFGNEVSGLSDGEMQQCHVAVTIPSSSDFPSLNLSHAVQIVAYEVYRYFRSSSGRRFYSPVEGEKLDALVNHITGSLGSLGFFKIVNADTMSRFWRDILARAALSGREAERMNGIFTKIAGISRKLQRDGKPRL
ncbi:MAG: RNA methyltransferase [Spirochaetales bacterium]|jgi:tRNA/rRNA methyltransferase|nr:RNA methyltransferase [Spirochaetales bacterium]